MKYIFTTLAIDKPYLDSAISLHQSLSEKSSCDFNITTNEECGEIPKLHFDKIKLDSYHDNRTGFSFYYNLKVLSLKYCLDKGYDYIVYTDADWRIGKEFSEQKFLNLFQHMEKNEIDFCFERPAPIGPNKRNIDNCFFQEKLRAYNVFEHDKWDDAHVVNEQFLVFKNNWKFRFFVRKWEEFLWYSIKNNIWNYAEGFEIGVSALESQMKWDYLLFPYFLKECFEFNDKLGNLWIRF
jgi:hypothetical protein